MVGLRHGHDPLLRAARPAAPKARSSDRPALRGCLVGSVGFFADRLGPVIRPDRYQSQALIVEAAIDSAPFDGFVTRLAFRRPNLRNDADGERQGIFEDFWRGNVL